MNSSPSLWWRLADRDDSSLFEFLNGPCKSALKFNRYDSNLLKDLGLLLSFLDAEVYGLTHLSPFPYSLIGLESNLVLFSDVASLIKSLAFTCLPIFCCGCASTWFLIFF